MPDHVHHDDDTHDHAHGHDHGHAHDHGPDSEQQPPPGISVMLDIGGEVGALIVYLASSPIGGELEARPVGDHDRSHRFHTGVHPRPSSQGEVLSAVFPEVTDGSYELLDVKGAPNAVAIATVRVTGGEVTELDLRLAPPS